LWQGDFFKLSPTHVNRVTALFDRAALVALPPLMRQRYVQHLVKILPKKVKVLLISFEYDQDGMETPPFTVNAAEIQKLYQNKL
jgi:thiopurine S-methyltransferase